jgi:hypothetical protein
VTGAPARLRVGVNFPGWRWASDFGARTYWPRAEWRSFIDQRLALFRRLGIFAIRWFLLCDGTQYGARRWDDSNPYEAPRWVDLRPQPLFAGLQSRDLPGECQRVVGSIPPNDWTAEPTLLPEGFAEDFEFLLGRCVTADIKLMPCLISFEWFNQPSLSTYVHPQNQFLGGGRWALINDPVKRSAFLDSVLRPLLQVSSDRRYAAAIHSWDLVNETEQRTLDAWPNNWAPWSSGVRTDGGVWRPYGNVDPKTATLDGMLGYISEGAAMVRQAGHNATVGFLRADTIHYWADQCTRRLRRPLGLNVHQFHYYGRWPLPSQPLPTGEHCILGEIATAQHTHWPDVVGTPEDLRHRLRILEQKGYREVFLWSADPRGNARRYFMQGGRRVMEVVTSDGNFEVLDAQATRDSHGRQLPPEPTDGPTSVAWTPAIQEMVRRYTHRE